MTEKAQADAKAAAAFYHGLILSRVEALAALQLTISYMQTRAVAESMDAHLKPPKEDWER